MNVSVSPFQAVASAAWIWVLPICCWKQLRTRNSLELEANNESVLSTGWWLWGVSVCRDVTQHSTVFNYAFDLDLNTAFTDNNTHTITCSAGWVTVEVFCARFQARALPFHVFILWTADVPIDFLFFFFFFALMVSYILWFYLASSRSRALEWFWLWGGRIPPVNWRSSRLVALRSDQSTSQGLCRRQSLQVVVLVFPRDIRHGLFHLWWV